MIHEFTDILEQINDDSVREFTVDGMMLYGEDEALSVHLKTIVNYLIEVMEVSEPDDGISDIIISAGLLHAVGGTPMNARIGLTSLMPKIGRDNFNNILYLIERQDAFANPYPEYQPQLDSPIHVWLLPMAKHLAKRG